MKILDSIKSAFVSLKGKPKYFSEFRDLKLKAREFWDNLDIEHRNAVLREINDITDTRMSLKLHAFHFDDLPSFVKGQIMTYVETEEMMEEAN